MEKLSLKHMENKEHKSIVYKFLRNLNQSISDKAYK